MKILVTYYSRTGTTQRLAERLARELGASIERISEAGSRKGFFGYQRSLIEATLGLSPRIRRPRHELRDYDLVVIGTPIWGWHLSSPVRSFARDQANNIRRTAFFCTMGGSGGEAAFTELQKRLGGKPVATLALTADELTQKKAEAEARLKRFVDTLLEFGSTEKTQPLAQVA